MCAPEDHEHSQLVQNQFLRKYILILHVEYSTNIGLSCGQIYIIIYMYIHCTWGCFKIEGYYFILFIYLDSCGKGSTTTINQVFVYVAYISVIVSTKYALLMYLW